MSLHLVQQAPVKDQEQEQLERSSSHQIDNQLRSEQKCCRLERMSEQKFYKGGRSVLPESVHTAAIAIRPVPADGVTISCSAGA